MVMVRKNIITIEFWKEGHFLIYYTISCNHFWYASNYIRYKIMSVIYFNEKRLNFILFTVYLYRLYS